MKTNTDARKQTHLVSCDVGHRQLGLVVQHLLKVGHMPGGICGVTVKTLRKQMMKGWERERMGDGGRVLLKVQHKSEIGGKHIRESK